jgi:hypothetical protein
MLTVYIDDSGTAPAQQVAIASGLILPTKRLIAFENEWKNFLEKEGITEFHTSVCVARNKHSEYADWDEKRVQRIVARVRQIIRKYFPKAFSISINKALYDAVIPDELRRVIGKQHYSWGVDAVCGFIWNWAHDRRVPIEYVFDNLDRKSQKAQKEEIEAAMSHGELMHPGDFAGHYSFRNRREVYALQCADLFAWTCYQRSLEMIAGKPLHPIAEECWKQFALWDNAQWSDTWIAPKDALEDWVRRVYADPVEMARIRNL